MKFRLFILCCFILNGLYANADESIQYSGTYSYDLKPDRPEGRYGHMTITHIEDNTYSFNMSLGRGAPSYNTGELEGKIAINDGKAVYYSESEYDKNAACEWKVTLTKDALTIETLNGHIDCDFGYGVYVDGKYDKESK